jgi:hypothetical protein
MQSTTPHPTKANTRAGGVGAPWNLYVTVSFDGKTRYQVDSDGECATLGRASASISTRRHPLAGGDINLSDSKAGGLSPTVWFCTREYKKNLAAELTHPHQPWARSSLLTVSGGNREWPAGLPMGAGKNS